MKCICCDKELDVTKSDIPPKWFGKYTGGKLVVVICDVCTKKPNADQLWKA